MQNNDFAIFILTHGRPERIKTLNTLSRCGYTGEWYLILDDEDPTIKETKDMYGETHIVVFNKKEAVAKTDTMDNFTGANTIVFARNMCNDIARGMGLKYFAEFEDDYTDFEYRVIDGNILKTYSIKDFDGVVNAMIEALSLMTNNHPRFRALAFCQGGDFIGGAKNAQVVNCIPKRKAMNTFFFKVSTDKQEDVQFLGRMNDDVNLYTIDGMRGGLWFSIPNIMVVQLITQSQNGGNSDAYKKYGTYVKSFYSVMAEPSCVRISAMGDKHYRIHHQIRWDNCTPMIISEKYKKEEK